MFGCVESSPRCLYFTLLSPQDIYYPSDSLSLIESQIFRRNDWENRRKKL
jgi:hypothetical protein